VAVAAHHCLQAPVEQQPAGRNALDPLPHQQGKRRDEQQREAVVPPDKQLARELEDRHEHHEGNTSQVQGEQRRAGQQAEQRAHHPVDRASELTGHAPHR
jgi:hypothetical protein